MFKVTWYEGEGDDMQRVSSQTSDTTMSIEFDKRYLNVGVCDTTGGGKRLPAPYVFIDLDGILWEGYLSDLRKLLEKSGCSKSSTTQA